MRTSKFKGWMQESLGGKRQSEEWRRKHKLDWAEVPSLWAGAMKTWSWSCRLQRSQWSDCWIPEWSYNVCVLWGDGVGRLFDGCLCVQAQESRPQHS